MKSCFPIPLLAITVFVSGCSSSPGIPVDKLQEALAKSRITLAQSVATGEAAIPESHAIKAALLVESDPEYSVNALGSGTLHDVRVDITNGSVLSTTSLGIRSDPCPGSIPVAEAIAIAEARVSGTAVKVQPDDDDPCYREVQVLSGDTVWEVKLTRDGQVLEVERADGD